MSSKGFTFNQPVVLGANSLDRMSFDDFFDMGELEGSLPSFPPKTIKQIIQLVDQGKSDQISILEWLDTIDNQKQWDELGAGEVNNACRAIWYAMCTNATLGDIAFFKVALALDGKPTSIIPDLIDSMDIVRGVSELAELEREKIDWLQAIRSKSYQSMVQYCFERKRTPKEYVKYLRLPKANSYERQLPVQLIKVVPQQLTYDTDRWLHRCFTNLKTNKDKLAFCNTAISHFEGFDYGDHVEQILEEKCLPTGDDTYWYSLSEQSKSILKKKFNISSYYELQSISKLLTSEHAQESCSFEDHEVRQIHSRTMFWSNYSSRFNRIRALLPELTFDYLVNQGYEPSDQVERLSKESVYQCEVLIFELDKIIAVEFLRGDLSETRFFKNTEWHAKRLFESADLTIQAIREMTQLDVHDHLTSWQYFCEKLLRTKFKLLPNDDIPFFKGLPPAVNSYNQTRGLPRPEQSYLDERARKLELWLERFWNTEFSTSKYGEQSGLEQKSNVYLSKAHIAKQLGNNEQHELYIKKSANQGNPEAMNQLGQILLKNSDVGLRRHGERWLAKAAVQGHVNAQTLVKKFNIKVEHDADYYQQRLKAHRHDITKGHYKLDATLKIAALRNLSVFDLERKFRFIEHNVGDLIVMLKELESRSSKEVTQFKATVTDRLDEIFESFV
ncbi:EH signature domain-containing protein [Vibrio sp. PNB22_2_2]